MVWSADSHPGTVTDAYAYAKNLTNTYGANVGESLTNSLDADTAVGKAGYTNPADPAQYLASSATDAAGNVTNLAYDGGVSGGPGNPTTTTDASAAAAKVSYYTGGLLNTSTDPINVAANNPTTYSDSPMLLPYSVAAPTGSTLGTQLIAQDVFGRTLLSEDGRGLITTDGYDKWTGPPRSPTPTAPPRWATATTATAT